MININDRQDSIWDFCTKWRNKGKEDSDDRTFWIDILQQVLGSVNATNRIVFQKKVFVNGRVKKIDAYIPETKILIEQKSYGIPLNKKILQSDGIYLTPYEQAKRYNDNLPTSEKALWIVISNFKEFWVYNMDVVIPEQSVFKFYTVDLTKDASLFDFLLKSNFEKVSVSDENEFNNKKSHPDGDNSCKDRFFLSEEFAVALLGSEDILNWSKPEVKIMLMVLSTANNNLYKGNLDNLVILKNEDIFKTLGWSFKEERKQRHQLRGFTQNMVSSGNIHLQNFENTEFYELSLFEFISVKRRVTHIMLNSKIMPHLTVERLMEFKQKWIELYKKDVLSFERKNSFWLYLSIKVLLNKTNSDANGIHYLFFKLTELKKSFALTSKQYMRKNPKTGEYDSFSMFSFEKICLSPIITELQNCERLSLLPYENEKIFKRVFSEIDAEYLIGYEIKCTEE